MLSIGDKFDTDFEKGCVVTSLPTEWGSFLAIDSEGVECEFGVEMVIGHPNYRPLNH